MKAVIAGNRPIAPAPSPILGQSAPLGLTRLPGGSQVIGSHSLVTKVPAGEVQDFTCEFFLSFD